MLFGQEHIDRYEETDGKEGHDWEKGTKALILTTTGRKSGDDRKAPLIYGEADGNYLLVASKGGADKPPAWYLNLRANPEAKVQVWGDRFDVHARDASDEEKPRLWKVMTEEWPDYDQYQTKTERQIPVVVLERS